MPLVVAGAVAEADGDGRAAAGGGRGGEVGRVVVPLQAVCRGIQNQSGVTIPSVKFMEGCQILSYQKGLMTSRPKEEGHFTGKHVTSAVAASQWQNLK